MWKMHVEKKRIFIGNLPLSTNEIELKNSFGCYGEVLSVELKQRHESSRFAFVDLNINPKKLNDCFEGLKHREWRGHDITLELAKESFLSRLQRERQQQQQQQTLSAAAPEQSSDSSEDESPHKGRLAMFGGTKRVLEEPLAERKRAATESDVLHRLESFSDVWKDDSIPSQGSPWRKNQVKGSQAETSFKSLKKQEHKAVSNGTTFKATATMKQQSLSEQRRLKSLDEKKRIFNEQKKLIQCALASVDSKQTLNKKIVFDSDDSDEESMKPLSGTERQGAARAALFDEDSGDENSFTINRQFEGEKGRKLLELQSRYGNDERFKLDERFRDEQSKVEQLSEQEEDERTQNLKILGSVLGREIPLCDRKKHKNVSKPMLRFDPTKPDHVKYEIKKSSSPMANGTAEKKKTAVEIKSEPNLKVSKEKFYKVSESLKKSFQKTDGESFSLRKMFGSDDDEKKEDSDYHASPKEGSRSHNRGWSQNPFKYDSSDQEDEEAGRGSAKKTDKVPSLPQESSKSEVQLLQGNTFFFLPDDVRLSEGVEFFNRKRTNVKKNENFSEYRRNLKRFAKKKVKTTKLTVHKKRGMYSLHRKVKKLGRRGNHYHGLVSRRDSN